MARNTDKDSTDLKQEDIEAITLTINEQARESFTILMIPSSIKER
jgi:hypothetical protein